MRFLADECFDERLAVRLRSASHDVMRVPARSGLDDLAVAGKAERDDRLLLTQDTDFGEVAVRHGRPRTGVILLCVAVTDPDGVADRLVRLVETSGQELAGRITVLTDRRIRSRPID